MMYRATTRSFVSVFPDTRERTYNNLFSVVPVRRSDAGLENTYAFMGNERIRDHMVWSLSYMGNSKEVRKEFPFT